MPRAVRVTGFGPIDSSLNANPSQVWPVEAPYLRENPVGQIMGAIAGTVQGLAQDKMRREYRAEQSQLKASEAQYQSAMADILELQRKVVDNPNDALSVIELDDALQSYSQDPALAPNRQNSFREMRLERSVQRARAEEKLAEQQRSATVAQLKRALTSIKPIYETDLSIREAMSSMPASERLVFIRGLVLDDLEKTQPPEVYQALLEDPEASDLMISWTNEIFNAHKSEISKQVEEIHKRTVADSMVTLANDTLDSKYTYQDYSATARDWDPSLTQEQIDSRLLSTFKDRLMDTMKGSGTLEEKSRAFHELSKFSETMPSHLAYEASTALEVAAGLGGQEAASEVSARLSVNLRGYYAVNEAGISQADQFYASRARGFGLEIPEGVPFNSISPPPGPEGAYLKELQEVYGNQRTEASKIAEEDATRADAQVSMDRLLQGTVMSPEDTRKAATVSPLFTITSTPKEQLTATMLPFVLRLKDPRDREVMLSYLSKAQTQGVDPNDPEFPAEQMGRIEVALFRDAPEGRQVLLDRMRLVVDRSNTSWGPNYLAGMVREFGDPTNLQWQQLLAVEGWTAQDRAMLRGMMDTYSGATMTDEVDAKDVMLSGLTQYNQLNEFSRDPKSNQAVLLNKDYRRAFANMVGGDRENFIIDGNIIEPMNLLLSNARLNYPDASPKDHLKMVKNWLEDEGKYLMYDPQGNRMYMYEDPYKVSPTSYLPDSITPEQIRASRGSLARDTAAQIGEDPGNRTFAELLMRAAEKQQAIVPGFDLALKDIQFRFGIENPEDQQYISSGRGTPVYMEYFDDMGRPVSIRLMNERGGPLLINAQNFELDRQQILRSKVEKILSNPTTGSNMYGRPGASGRY